MEKNDLTRRINKLREELAQIGYNLYPHQIEGIQWMLEREILPQYQNGGLLCDDPGLGKTIQTLALIKANNFGGRQLIICPVSLIEQWRDVASKVFPGKRIRPCHGSFQFENSKEIEKINPFITIASYQAVFGTDLNTKDSEDFKKTPLHFIEWERVILDECHIIRNKNTKVFKGCHDIKAKYRWGLSGTPLQNKLADLQNLFRYLHFSEVSILGNMEGLKEDYIMRRNRHILPNAYKELDVQIEDLEFDTTEEQNFYHSIKDTIKKEFLRAKAEDTNYMSTIFELLLRLRQATIHPSIVLNGLYRKYKEEDDDSIDLKVLENKIRYWNKRSSTKMNRLVEMFGKHNSTTKSIIFTHYTEESNMVYKCLQNSYGELNMEIFDGSLSIDKRNSMIKRAQNGEIDCLIVQILCGGVGLNLQMFNRVYIITPNWNPSNEIQAIARCHRIGQTENVVVVKLIIKEEDMKSTIDEKILVVQQEKRVLMAEHLNDSSLLFNEESVSGGLNLTMKDFQFLFR